MADSKIVNLMSERRQLADRAAALGQENLVLREANAKLMALQQELNSARDELAMLRGELAMLRRSRPLRVARKIRQLLGFPHWN